MIAFGFASHWLKNWREIFKLITKRSNCNRASDSHVFKNCSIESLVSKRFFFFLLSSGSSCVGSPYSPSRS